MDQHLLARREAAAQLQREVRSVVVQDEAGALLEAELVGELEGEERRRDDDLGEAAEHAERRHPVTRA